VAEGRQVGVEEELEAGASEPGSVTDRTAATMSSVKSEGMRSLLARSMPLTTPRLMT
jgi:hypothetical protein